MNLEDELRADLERDARAQDVDVTTLYATTRARLSRESQRSHMRSGTRAGLLAAAAVVLVGGVGLATPAVTDRLFADDLIASEGEVAAGFSCPSQQTIDVATSDDDAFLPELAADGEPIWEPGQVVPRYEVRKEGELVLLRLGNADGTLASTTTFTAEDGGYRRVAVTKCSNAAAEGAELPPLVSAGLASTGPGLRAQDVSPRAVLVVDRLTYDVAGLSKRITAYAYPCGARLCLESGSERGDRVRASLPRAATPTDATSLLADPDDMVGTEPAQLFVALYDAAGAVTRATWTDPAGVTTSVSAVEAGPWRGQLFLVLAPAGSLDELSLEGQEGEIVTYGVGDLRR